MAKAESHGLDQPDTISPLAGPIFLLGDDLRFGKATYLPRKTMAIAHPKAVMAEAMAATAASTASKVTAVKDTILKVKVKTTPLTSLSTIRTNTHSRPVLLHTDFLTYFAFPLPSRQAPSSQRYHFQSSLTLFTLLLTASTSRRLTLPYSRTLVGI